MSNKFNTKNDGLVTVLALIVLSAIVFYTLPDNLIVVATINQNIVSVTVSFTSFVCEMLILLGAINSHNSASSNYRTYCSIKCF